MHDNEFNETEEFLLGTMRTLIEGTVMVAFLVTLFIWVLA